MTGARAPAHAYRIEPLAAHHDRTHFECGQPSLDSYLHERARKEMANHTAAVFVALPSSEPHVIAGYYTLSNMTADASALPVASARKLPRYPMLPATLLGRLAVTKQHQGRGLGEHLLIDALGRSLATTASVGSVAVVVDPINDRARAFYEKYQFTALADQPGRLFLPMGTIELGMA
ncbi:MAG: GNAT family N-acetyltransferase [Deltaproteobacteria bacterium]|nr:GNAT family N-acetyltransferase [Deltaproteobacteria bacterium]